MDTCQHRGLRDGLLLLLQALIMPRTAVPTPTGSDASANQVTSALSARARTPTVATAQPSAGSGAAGNHAVTSSSNSSALPAAAVRAAKANGYLLLDHGGVELLVDVVAGAHESRERRAAATGPQAAAAGFLITSISHAEVQADTSPVVHIILELMLLGVRAYCVAA